MQHLPAPIHHARDAAQLPVAIDYPAALALRQMSMVHDELPKYLLAPEVSALLHYVPDLRRKMLLATLWNTGARINEALALTRGDFSLSGSCGMFRTDVLRKFGFSDRTKVEDLDLTWTLVANGYRIRQANRCIVYPQECNSLLDEWRRWRRWMWAMRSVCACIKGFY
nr:glycosyltransferase family 2 protein [Escherichia coli]